MLPDVREIPLNKFELNFNPLTFAKVLREIGKTGKAVTDDGSKVFDNKEINGGADGTRTRDLQRDRLAF